MQTIICEKQFRPDGHNYTQKDIKIFNEVIMNGIRELKGDWTREKYDGIDVTETENELRICLDETKINFVEIFSNIKRIKYDMLAVIDNYAIPYTEI